MQAEKGVHSIRGRMKAGDVIKHGDLGGPNTGCQKAT